MDPLKVVKRDCFEILRIAEECLEILPGDNQIKGYGDTLILEYELEENVISLKVALEIDSISNLRQARLCTLNIEHILESLSYEIPNFKFKLPLELKKSVNKGFLCLGIKKLISHFKCEILGTVL